MADAPVRPLSYPKDAVLTIDEVRAWLGDIGERTFYRRGIKHVDGMVLAAWVYEYLERKGASGFRRDAA